MSAKVRRAAKAHNLNNIDNIEDGMEGARVVRVVLIVHRLNERSTRLRRDAVGGRAASRFAACLLEVCR